MISLTRSRIFSQVGMAAHAMPPSMANIIMSGSRMTGGPRP